MRALINLVLIFCIFVSSAWAATYYVDGSAGDCAGTYSPTYRDCAGGHGDSSYTSHDIAADFNSTVSPGDTVYIRGGTVSYEEYLITGTGIDPATSGTSGNRITYQVYTGEKVRFKANARVAYAVDLTGIDYVSIKGDSTYPWQFEDFYRTIWIYNGADYNEIAYVEQYGVWADQFSAWQASHNYSIGDIVRDTDLYGYVVFEVTTDSGSSGGSEPSWGYDPNDTTIDGGLTWTARTSMDYRNSSIFSNSNYNWVHDSIFRDNGFYTPSTDGGGIFELGSEGSTTTSSYNVIEDCKFYHGGHHALGIHDLYNVVRDNHFHNEKWWLAPGDSKYYGYRNLYVAGYNGGSTNHGYNLIEGNRISHAGPNIIPGNCGGSGISLNQSNDIIRYNSIYANGLGGIYIQCGSGEECLNNHIYNNTWLSNGFLDNTQPSDQTGCLLATDAKRRPICIWVGVSSQSIYQGNTIKNNLMWKNQQGPEANDQIVSDDDLEADLNTVMASNWTDPSGDPKLTDEGDYSSPSMLDPDFSGCDPTDTTNPDLSLQSSSPLIDNGTWLTQANGASSGCAGGSPCDTLTVDDARYFHPAWGNGAGGGAVVEADTICISSSPTDFSGCTQIQISSINYSTKVLTLVSQISWNDNDYIILFEDSEGTQVLQGSMPDQGAYEYQSAAPSILSITVAPNGTTITITANEALTQGVGYNDSDLDIDCSITGNDISLTYSSGDGTATLIYTAGSTIQYNDVCNFDFNGDTDSLENGSSVDLPAIVSQSVDNNSSQGVTANTGHTMQHNAAGKIMVPNASGLKLVTP